MEKRDRSASRMIVQSMRQILIARLIALKYRGRLLYKAVIAFVCGIILWALYYVNVTLPDRREAAMLVTQRIANSRTIPSLNLDLIWIAPGSFLMGSPEQSPWMKLYYAVRQSFTQKKNPRARDTYERPTMWVTLTQPFWLGRTPVTQGQYQLLMGSNPSTLNIRGSDGPVNNVSWTDAIEFCKKLTNQEQDARRLPKDYIYTLPTEAEWEYACRAGMTADYTVDFETETNGWGLLEMNGDVTQWCRDWSAPYPGGMVTDPSGPKSGMTRIARGGGCQGCDEELWRVSFRGDAVPESHMYTLGFRVALCPDR